MPLAPAMVSRQAFAKVNLSLRVVGRRGDGYHELQSLVVFAGVADGLTLAPAPDLCLQITGPFADALAPSADNLVLRAAAALRAYGGVAEGASITLDKRLPVAAGIGGGSADAAATLEGLAELWSLDLSAAELAEIALPLGADLPVCLTGRAALVGGIGERIEPVPGIPDAWLVLANPGVALATSAVFAARQGRFSAILDALGDWGRLDDLVAWLRTAGNDLAAPARRLCPAIDRVLSRLDVSESCLLAQMSGSGATCYGLFANRRAAERAAAEIGHEQPAWWIAAAPLITAVP